jgi:outer membrane protein TolC
LCGLGCTSSDYLARSDKPAGITSPLQPPALTPLTSLPQTLPEVPQAPKPQPDDKPPVEGQEVLPPPKRVLEPQDRTDAARPDPESTPLTLEEVLASVERSFPLLLAAEQERAIAAGRRLSAEGAFDLNLRLRGLHQEGTFPSDRLDLLFEQPTPWYGLSFTSGYRLGLGDFPVYYGDRSTAEAGEYRFGLNLPLLRDGPIDRRRALLRQAQLGEPLAETTVQRARIDYYRAAAYRYWNWAAAGEQYFIARELLRIAQERQAGFEEQFRLGAIAEFVVVDNRRLIIEREGILIAAERRLQQAALDLSLYLRDEAGNPQIPPVSRLPRGVFDENPTPPDVRQLQDHLLTALNYRPEWARFQLLKRQTAVELQLAENQILPALNLSLNAAQDTGIGKKGEGMFQLDRTMVEAGVLFEVPLQRREARGRATAADAVMMQLLAQEQFIRDQIVVEVQDALSNLDRTYARLERAREELRVAERVAEMERERFQRGQSNLLEVNLRELAAAGAQSKVVDALADYYRALADFRAALGLDAGLPVPVP